MDEMRNRASPKLQFHQEELCSPATERHATKAKNTPVGKKQQAGEAHSVSAKATEEAPGVKETARKKTVRLRFEETRVKKPSKIVHQVQETTHAVSNQLHRQAARSNEDDNVAVNAVLKADDVRESALRAGEHAYHAHKLRKNKQVGLERGTNRRSTASEGVRSSEHPQFESNPISRWQQKQAIRKEYAAANTVRSRTRGTEQTVRTAGRAVKKTSSAAERLTEFVSRHHTALTIIALVAMILFLMSSLQACTPLAQSVLESIVIGTYPAEEEDVRAAEFAYANLERQLKDEMDHYRRYHPEYDEVHVDADEIWHDPYVLIAIISACYDGQDWNIDSAMPVIEKYFSLQYVVTETVTTETRYRTEREQKRNPETGQMETTTVQIPYVYTVCNVRLENKNLSHLPVLSMSHHTMGMYALYMATHGNMEGIFRGNPHAVPLKDPMLYDIPEETLTADSNFARLMEEAEKYIGYPYVWGGDSPETSFDCSGFVSYVFTNSGVYNTGRLGAKGLRSLCRNVPADQVRPGDIVFFDGTMGEGVEGITHCGIYVGNNMMIHCGSPIGYAKLSDSYWRKHFHSYGRVPGL